MLRSAKNELQYRCSVFRGKPGRWVPSVSFAHPTRNEVSGVGTRGACAKPLGHHYILHEHTFSNTGNIPTLHQPKVTVTTITLTSAHGGVPILNIHLTIYSIWQISQRMVVHTYYNM